ncbi:MAG: hypothetical protein JW741_07670 [Sedimentisphaerales bacterium]|nr:hypothetical protein [Sedimentisphaerales bacterium]
MHRKYSQQLSVIYAVALALWAIPLRPSLPVCMGNAPPRISDGWVATDALGRKLPDHAEVGDPRPDRTVAMFYWTWHVGGKTDLGPANANEIVTRHSDAVNDYNHPAWEEIGRIVGHHWNEPLFGYYRGTDPWVYRKHAEMLADAGVDVVVFDCTNGTFTWKEAYDVLGESWLAARRDGVRTPQFAFLCPFAPHDDSRINITKIYEDVYEPGRFKDLWFYWKGKPLLMGYPDNLPEPIRSFFTFRPGQPDYRKGPSRPNHWGWLEVCPQHGYVELAPGGFEQVTVGVSQNATDVLAPAAMNDPRGSYGRGYTKAHGFNHDPQAVARGLNFQEQWTYALKMDPELIFVTGWNEWIAGRYKSWQGTENAFPDQFNNEYSRDIEPMKGGFSDNYYYQLVANIRRYKGLKAPAATSPPVAIEIDGKFEEWTQVRPEFLHYKGSTMHRNHRGYGKTFYENSSGRNDFVTAKVARDAENVYFYIETADPITEPAGPGWMTLLIDIDRDKSTGWQGYDYAVSRRMSTGHEMMLERSQGEWSWSEVGKVGFRIEGNRMELRVPRTLLDVASNSPLDFEFKWTDNVLASGDVLDLYLYGDVAPGGRFNYRYHAP